MFASLGTHLGSTIVEGQSTLKVGVMCVGTARANFVVGVGNSADEIEGKGVRLESFGVAEGTGASGRLMRNSGGRARRFGLDIGRSVSNWFDPYIHGGEVQVKQRRV